MSKSKIHIYNEKPATNPLRGKTEFVKKWLVSCCESKGLKIQELNYVFCSDEYLLEINKEHLNHDYYTDIITFDLSEEANSIEAEVYISVDRVVENSIAEQTVYEDEMLRVVIHGLLHLLGYSDKTEAEKSVMREEENFWISKYKQVFHVEHLKLPS